MMNNNPEENQSQERGMLSMSDPAEVKVGSKRLYHEK